MVRIIVGLIGLYFTWHFLQRCTNEVNILNFIYLITAIIIFLHAYRQFEHVFLCWYRRKRIMNNYDHKYSGKIVDYCDDENGLAINGMPFASIIVEYAKDCKKCKTKFSLDSTDTSKYPIGSYIYIYEKNNELTWDKKIHK